MISKKKHLHYIKTQLIAIFIATTFTFSGQLHLSAQNDSLRFIDNLIDEIENLSDIDIDGENLQEEYAEFLSKSDDNILPNINALSYFEAVNILKMNDFQYYQLQLYIEKHGQLYTIYEIDAIEGFSRTDRMKLCNKIVILPPPKEKKNIKTLLKEGKNICWLRYGRIIEKQKGFDTTRNNHYSGTPSHLTFRYEYSNNEHFSIKIAGEKDPGEQFFRGEQKYGFDHYSGSVSIKNVKFVKRAVLGDFKINYAHGLTAGSALFSGIGSGIVGMRNFTEEIRPIAATTEGNFFRGVGVTLGNSSISFSGHLGKITETDKLSYGMSASYRKSGFKIGAQIICYGTIADSTNAKSKIESALTPEQICASVNYSASFRKQITFGEIAINEKAKIAVFNSTILTLSPNLKLGITLRHYARNFNSFMGKYLRESNSTCGESGIYATGHLTLSRKAEADVFCDYYTLHWLSYRTDAPSSGCQLGTTLYWNISKNSSLSIRYRWKAKQTNEISDLYMRRITDQMTHRIRVQWNNSPFHFLKLKSEISFALNRTAAEKAKKGILMYQDAAFVLKKPQLSVHFRAAYFDTDSYEERLYAYENDVYYAFNIGSYYYQGVRFYAMLRYKIKNMSFWLRIGRTKYTDRDEIGSGLTLIEKPHKTEVKFQCLFKF